MSVTYPMMTGGRWNKNMNNVLLRGSPWLKIEKESGQTIMVFPREGKRPKW